MKDIEYWSAFSGTVSEQQQLNELLQLVNPLSTDAKAALVKHLLDTSGLTVGLDLSQDSSLIAQISTMEQAALGDVIQAIAVRIQSS